METDWRDSAKFSFGENRLREYRAPWWLPGGHLQTIYAYFLKRETHLCLRRERWETPDNDFIDLDWLDSSDDSANLLVLFHGLEGCSSSHYAQSLMNYAGRRSWRGVIPHFRGCSGEHNRLVRAYHSGDSSEIDWILRRLKKNNPRAKIHAIGVSLGGNVLLKWLGEQGDRALEIIEKAAAVSAPIDLAAAAGVLDRGCRKLIYTRYFLRTLKQKSLYKVARHELKIDLRRVRAASTFRQLDDLFTAPVHGFDSAEDYWDEVEQQTASGAYPRSDSATQCAQRSVSSGCCIAGVRRSFPMCHSGISRFRRSRWIRIRKISRRSQLATLSDFQFLQHRRVVAASLVGCIA